MVANTLILLSFMMIVVLLYKIKIKKVKIFSNSCGYNGDDNVVCPKCFSTYSNNQSEHLFSRWVTRTVELCSSCERDESLAVLLGKKYNLRLYRLNKFNKADVFSWYYAMLIICVAFYFMSFFYEPYYLAASVLLFLFTCFVYIERTLKMYK